MSHASVADFSVFNESAQNVKRQAWLAMLGLASFITLYFLLAVWFSYTTCAAFAFEGTRDSTLFRLVTGFASGFLAIFMFKALFFVKRGALPDVIEVTAQEQPSLFRFLYQLADDAGAPRPHRVFLSARVNAAVFYDLSLLNLIFPAKKNLEIGLALVNTLNLTEMKAVLAHEFGHFAQKSMAVGRWIYIAHQITAHIVERRDALDKFLRVISGIDIRIAWVGWFLRLIVWSIRAVLESAFRLTMLAERALSREMEYQADLVAVSLTGSDAIVHALHRLQAADEAWERAQSFLFSELQAGRLTVDLFAVQQRIIDRMAIILNNPGYGKSPQVPTQKADTHRVFTAEIAQPPRMWATHPQNHERENNAKRVYIPTRIDERSAWTLFDNSEVLKAQMTRHLVRHMNDLPEPGALDLTFQQLDQQYEREFLRAAYRGAYLGRSFVRDVNDPNELFDPDIEHALKQLERLYPNSLRDDLERLRNLERERALLEAIRDGYYTAPDGVIRHRGKTLVKRELPQVINELKVECRNAQAIIRAHDKACRSAHFAAAKSLATGWDDYLLGLTKVMHYADHSDADLQDAYGALNNVIAIVTADRHVSKSELMRVVNAAQDVFQVLNAIYRQADTVKLDRHLLSKLEMESWATALGEFKMSGPTQSNINQWLDVIPSWVSGTSQTLNALRQASLDLLLKTELHVVKAYKTSAHIDVAPTATTVPEKYKRLLPGTERARQTTLGWWDKFQTADGIVAASLRFVIAGGVIGSALVISWQLVF